MASPYEMSSCQVTKDRLTNREKEIVVWIAEGLTSWEIAAKLVISADTVDTHRKNILKKLQMKNTAALVKYSILQCSGLPKIYLKTA